MTIPLRLHPFVQISEGTLQILPLRLLRDSIHPDRRILAAATIGAFSGWHLNQMSQ